MSIIIGIICDHGIVMAADSQTTYTSAGGDTSRQTETPKISVAEFSQDAVLIAEAGDASLSGQAVDFFRELSTEKDLSDYRTAADVAMDAVAKVRRELRKQHSDCSAEELSRFIQEHSLNFQLMIAHHHQKQPYIFTINFETGTSKKCVHQFEAIGCGSGIAAYVLSRFGIKKDFPFLRGLLAALYAIEETKKVDPFCGGKTRMAIISPRMHSKMFGETKADLLRYMLECDYEHYVKRITEMDKEAMTQWAAKMDSVILEMSSRVGKISPSE